MIAVDTNVLVYAHRADSEFHSPAAQRLRELAEGRSGWALPWPCLHEFFSVVTHPRIFRTPTAPVAAVDQLDAWLESPSVVVLTEGPTHWARLKPLLVERGIRGAAVHEAKIAALCLEHGVSELWTADRDFGRFPELRVRNPLIGP